MNETLFQQALELAAKTAIIGWAVFAVVFVWFLICGKADKNGSDS